MSVQCEVVRGGTGFVASHGGNDNPAVKAIMAAMFTADNLPALNFTKTNDVQVQGIAGVDTGGVQLG